MELIIYLVLWFLLFIFISRTVLVSICSIFLTYRLLITKILFRFIRHFLSDPTTFNIKRKKSPKTFNWIYIDSFEEFLIRSSFLLTLLTEQFHQIGYPSFHVQPHPV